MLSIAIFGDNYDAELKNLIQIFFAERKILGKISFFDKPEDFIVVPGSFDVYIMDMKSKYDTLQLGKKMMKIDVGSQFIYICDTTEEACAAIKGKADYFLIRPYTKKDFFEIFTEVKRKVRKKSLIIQTPEGERKVKAEDVNYVNIVKRCLCYHLKDGTAFDGQTLRGSFEKAIDPIQSNDLFLFLAPSLLINVIEIKILDSDHLQFENGEILYFPKKHYNVLRERWANCYQV